MKLSALTSQYVAYKQAMGMRFHTEACTLQSFCRTMGDIAVADIAIERVHAYLVGTGPRHALLAPQIRGALRLLSLCNGTGIRRQCSASPDHPQTTTVCSLHLLASGTPAIARR